ncbi:MAG: GNAT family N-acetyltransferase [Betaproteobacteria bacterium]|nr:GNAT family N-acetyltransferase [Betaproteobacteria bacterium]
MLVTETPRLLIRSLAPDDAPSLVHVLGDAEVMRFSIKGVCTLEDIRQFIQRAMSSYAERGYGQWALVDKASSSVIGYCGFGPLIIDEEQQIEIGYRLARRYWSQGLITEAASSVLAHGFGQLGLDTVIAVIQPENIGSVRVAEKVGFRSFKNSRYHGHDVRIYRKKQSE